MTQLRRAIHWFVEPAPDAAPPEPPPARTAAPGSPPPLDPDPLAFDSGPGLRQITYAAVLGRPREAEPVAASLALALRRRLHARAATVVVTGEVPATMDPAASGGSSAARRVAAALTAHGLEATARGRLAWVRLPENEREAVAGAQRAGLVGPPAVLAITVPRTDAWDELLAAQDLVVVVTPDPEGPLVRLATATLPPVPVRIVRPLTRGPARSLARAGLKPVRPIGALLMPSDPTGR
jgi:hypothetical protein